MRIYILSLLLPMAVALHAQPKEPASVASEVLRVAESMVESEMRNCAGAYPQHAERFASSASRSRTKLQAALEGLREKRSQDLNLSVPELRMVGLAMTAALMPNNSARLTLDFCNRTADEMAQVTDQQATALMDQLVTTFLSGIAAHRKATNSAVR